MVRPSDVNPFLRYPGLIPEGFETYQFEHAGKTHSVFVRKGNRSYEYRMKMYASKWSWLHPMGKVLVIDPKVPLEESLTLLFSGVFKSHPMRVNEHSLLNFLETRTNITVCLIVRREILHWDDSPKEVFLFDEFLIDFVDPRETVKSILRSLSEWEETIMLLAR